MMLIAAGHALRGKASRFIRDDSGVISVDYVVLTAALFGLGLYAVTSAREGTTAAASEMRSAFAQERITVVTGS